MEERREHQSRTGGDYEGDDGTRIFPDEQDEREGESGERQHASEVCHGFFTPAKSANAPRRMPPTRASSLTRAEVNAASSST